MMGQQVKPLPDTELESRAGDPQVLPACPGREVNQFLCRDLSDRYLRDTVHGQFPDIFGHLGESPEIRADGSDLPVDPGDDPFDILFHEVNP